MPMTTSAGVSQSIVLDLLSLTVHSADIVQRVQDWGGRGRGLWTALATEFDCTPCQVMRLWSAMQLTAPVPAPPVQTLVSEPVPAPVLKPISQPVSEPVSDVFPTHGAKSSSSSASGAHLPLTVRPMLNLSPQELCVTVNAMRLFAETLGADLVTYLAAKLRKPEFEIRVALLCLTRDNLQLCESQIATKWYYKHFTEGNLSDARLVRTVIQCAAENNGFVSWGEVAVRVAVAPSALRLQWEIHLVRSAKLLYGILRDSAASAAASALDRSSAGPIHSAAEGTRSSSSGGGSSRSENPSAAAPSTTCAPITSTHDTTTAAAVATPSSSTTESAPLKSPADVEKTVTGAAAAAAEEGKVDAADVCSALGDMVTAVELHLATSTRGSPNLGPASLRSPTLAYMSAFRTMKQCEKRLKKIKGKQERPVKPRVPKVHTKCQRDDIESLLSAMDLPSSAANTKKKRDKSGKGKGKGNSEKEKRQYAKSRSLTEAERLSAKECIMEKRPGAPMKPLIKDLARRFGRSVLVMRMFLASLLRANSSLRDHLASGPLLGTPEAVTSLSQSQSLSHGSNAHLPLATNAVQNTPTTVQPNAPLIVPSEHSKRTDRELITALLCNASERQGKVNWLNLDIVRGVKRGASRARWLAALEGKVVVLYRHLRGIAKKQARVESAAAVSAATPSSSTSAAPSSGVCTGAANKAFSPSFVGSFDAQSAAAVASSARMETAAPVALSAHPAPPVHVATDCVVGCSTTRFAAARVSTGAPSGSAKESVSPTVPRPALDSAAFTEREVVQRVLGHIATAVELANFRGMTNESLGLPPRPKVNPYAPSKLRPTIQKVLNGMIKEVVHRQAKAAPSSSSASAAATASTGAGVGGEGALSIHAKAPRTGKVYNPNTTYKVRRAIQGLLEQMVKAVESAGTLHTTVHKPILQKRRFTEEEDAVILQYVRDALAAHKKINWADVDQQCGRQKSVTYIRWKYTLAAKYPELCSAKLGTAALKATPRKGSGPVASQPVLAMEEAVVATAGSSSSSQAALAGAEGDGDGGSGDRVSGGINGRGFGGEDSPQQSAAVRKTVASILGVIVQVVEMAAALRDETDGGLQR